MPKCFDLLFENGHVDWKATEQRFPKAVPTADSDAFIAIEALIGCQRHVTRRTPLTCVSQECAHEIKALQRCGFSDDFIAKLFGTTLKRIRQVLPFLFRKYDIAHDKATQMKMEVAQKFAAANGIHPIGTSSRNDVYSFVYSVDSRELRPLFSKNDLLIALGTDAAEFYAQVAQRKVEKRALSRIVLDGFLEPCTSFVYVGNAVDWKATYEAYRYVIPSTSVETLSTLRSVFRCSPTLLPSDGIPSKACVETAVAMQRCGHKKKQLSKLFGAPRNDVAFHLRSLQQRFGIPFVPEEQAHFEGNIAKFLRDGIEPNQGLTNVVKKYIQKLHVMDDRVYDDLALHIGETPSVLHELARSTPVATGPWDIPQDRCYDFIKNGDHVDWHATVRRTPFPVENRDQGAYKVIDETFPCPDETIWLLTDTAPKCLEWVRAMERCGFSGPDIAKRFIFTGSILYFDMYKAYEAQNIPLNVTMQYHVQRAHTLYAQHASTWDTENNIRQLLSQIDPIRLGIPPLAFTLAAGVRFADLRGLPPAYPGDSSTWDPIMMHPRDEMDSHIEWANTLDPREIDRIFQEQ